MRIYDPRVGRFLSTDPVAIDYPWLTPYQFAGNMPTHAIDLDGLEPMVPIEAYSNKGDPMGGVKGAADITFKAIGNFFKGMGKVVFGTLGAFTQMTGAAEYGDRIPKNEFARQFPSIANNNIAKDLVLPIFTTPIELANRVKKNPDDAELWGEVAGILAIAKGGKYTGKFLSGDFGLKVDLMGGPNSRYVDFINYDKNAKSGINDVVGNYKNHFGENTVREILVDKPQTDFLAEVQSSIVKNGTITIRGQLSNKFFKLIWDSKAKGLENFDVMPNSRKSGMSNEGYKRSDGTSLGGENNLNEIILIKK